MWYMYTIEYYSAIKKNRIMPFAAMWMDLEIIIQSEIRKRQIPHDFTYMWNLKYSTNEHIFKAESRQNLVLGVDAQEFPGGLLRLDPAFVYAEPPSS